MSDTTVVVVGEVLPANIAPRPVIPRSDPPPPIVAPIAVSSDPLPGAATDMGITVRQDLPLAVSTANAIVGTDGHDTLFAAAPGDLLVGRAGDDSLYGLSTIAPVGVVFDGGAGNDMILGSVGGDTYRHALGGGIDNIADYASFYGADAIALFNADPNAAGMQDRLEFGADIRPQDIYLERVGWDLHLDIDRLGSTDSVYVGNWFADGIMGKIETITFSDGTVWLASDVDHMLGEPSPGLALTGGGTLTGTQYDDTLTASAGGATLQGGAGNDLLSASVSGSVFGLVFEGGRGSDVIEGSYGGDTYLFNLGDGRDIIHDDVRALGPDVAAFFAAHPDTASYQDTLRFGAGIAAADVVAERLGDDLVLHVSGTDAVTVKGWYDGTMFDKIETFTFADSTTWFASDVDRLAGQASVGMSVAGGDTLTGSQYDDTLTATGYGTVLQGGRGDDVLRADVNGGVFNLVLEGGQGNDRLEGSYAGDTYRYALGDGRDTIHDDVRAMGPDVAAFFAAHPDTESYQDRLEFGAGISAGDVQLERVGSDLFLHVGSDGVKVEGWYDGTLYDKVETISFADGTTWQAADVDHMLGQTSPGLDTSGSGTLAGSQYDDTLLATGYGTVLSGGAGNDLLTAGVDGGIFGLRFEGGRGNDVLVGSYGGDTYAFNVGDGRDVITDDVRAMGPGVADFFAAHPDTASYQDRLEFGDGIAAADVSRTRVGSDLVLAVNDADAVTIHGWFDGTPFNKIELIGFADGTTWTAAVAEQGLG